MPEVWFPYLGIKIEKLNNIAFSILGIDIYWYGIIIAFGILLGSLATIREAKRTGQSQELYTDFLLYAIIVSIVFARLYYVIFSWDYYKDNLTEIFNIRNGGIAIYGAVIGGVVAAIFYTKLKKVSFWKFADTCSFGLLIGQILGRWGNFINREAFGGYTESIFAMRYLKNQVSDIAPQVLSKAIELDGASYIQVHPTFFYESIWNLGLLIFLFLYRRNKKFDGELTSFYFIGYGIGRFWIEGLRTDALTIGNTNLAISQILSLFFVISFSIFLLKKRKRI